MTDETREPEKTSQAPATPTEAKPEVPAEAKAAAPAETKPAAPAPPKPPAAPKVWEPGGEVVDNPASQALKAKFGAAVQGVKSTCGEATVLVEKAALLDALTFLRDDGACAMDYLSDMTAAHYPQNPKKFQVVYHAYSLSKNHSLRVKVQLDDGEACPTATGVWPGADWMEREAHDMFGVVFEGHPNPKVILLPDNFEGHPLRKEFPVGGAQEEIIRSNRYGKPVYLPDDVEEARKIIEEGRHGR